MRHHSTGSVSDDSRYRRSLTLEDIRRLVISRVSVRSGRRKQESIRLAEQIIKNLVRIRAMHSGFQLDCTNCNLEEWYAIDEVSETFRCRRCLSIQDRPLSPAISFRLNEALYQAYKSNFAVPALTLGLMARLSKTSFIYSPQITLTAGDGQSSELDIVAIMDGDLFVGEAKSGNSIARRKIAGIGQLATSVGAGCVVFSTTCRDSCHDIDCNECMRNRYYGDNAFTHGSSGVARDWGTRECIKDARGRLAGVGIQVVSICSRDIEQGDMSTMRLRYRPRSIRAPKIP